MTNFSSVKTLLIVPGGRDRAWLEEQKKSGGNVSRHVELANKEPARIFRKTMTSKKSERKAQKSCMTAHIRCRSINVLTFTFLVSRGKVGKCPVVILKAKGKPLQFITTRLDTLKCLHSSLKRKLVVFTKILVRQRPFRCFCI